jgi:hypothetical protein
LNEMVDDISYSDEDRVGGLSKDTNEVLGGYDSEDIVSNSNWRGPIRKVDFSHFDTLTIRESKLWC